MTAPSTAASTSGLRYVAALLVVALGCPVAIMAGEALGCVSQSTGIEAECALQGLLYSPFILVAAGVVAGLIAGGWRTLLLIPFAVLAGMILIFVVAWALGSRPPIGFVQGFIAMLWFLVPILIGFGIGRAATWAARMVRRR